MDSELFAWQSGCWVVDAGCWAGVDTVFGHLAKG